MSIGEFLAEYTPKLRAAGIASARLDCRLLVQHIRGRDEVWVLAHPEEQLESTKIAALKSLIAKRLKRIPMAYLLGHQEFYGYTFTVTPDVLIPRPETEALIETAKKIPAQTILDVGTGSGAIAITLALQTSAKVTASDISSQALNVARKNATTLGTTITFVKSNLLNKISGRFDMIVANLPYVDHSWERSPETNAEPALALFAEHDGLELIHKLIVQAPEHLAPKGHLLLEADPRQHEAIKVMAQKNGFNLIATDRFAIVLQYA